MNLGYCRRSVAAAWKRRQALETPEVEAEAIDVPARLASLARALPSSLAERDVAVRRLEALEGDPETVEIRLAEVDRDILEVAKEGLSDEDRQEVATDLTKALDRLRSRLPSEELERAAARLEERLVRERLALPVLSLFAPEALTNETSEAVTEPAA